MGGDPGDEGAIGDRASGGRPRNCGEVLGPRAHWGLGVSPRAWETVAPKAALNLPRGRPRVLAALPSGLRGAPQVPQAALRASESSLKPLKTIFFVPILLIRA